MLAISPADPQGFIRALQERFALGANRILEPELRRPPIWTWELWRDRAALLLIGLGLLGLLVMFGALCFRYPELSADLPLHFDVTGIPDRISPKSELFMLPVDRPGRLADQHGCWHLAVPPCPARRGLSVLARRAGRARHRRPGALQPDAVVSIELPFRRPEFRANHGTATASQHHHPGLQRRASPPQITRQHRRVRRPSRPTGSKS